MSLYKPQELLAFLNSLGIHPRKSLSQNFLIDGNILQKIASAAHVQPDDLILEIGPGPGALTECLLAKNARVIAVEKDAKLAHALERLQTSDQSLVVYEDDILKFPLEEILLPKLGSERRAKVIANLPYQLTTPILTKLMPLNTLFSSITVMVQNEVAHRFTARVNTKEYGAISVFLNFYGEVSYDFKVSRQCFFPAPKVDSAVITLTLKKPPEEIDQEAFFRLTRKAFEQRRKMLKSSLKNLYNPVQVETALETLGLSSMSRPENLSVKDFISLFQQLSKN